MFRWTRAGLVAAAAGVLLLTAANPASARPAGPDSAPSATSVTPQELGAIAEPVSTDLADIFGFATGLDRRTGLSVFRIDLKFANADQTEVQQVQAFCTDLHHELQAGEPYVEADWDKAQPGADLAKERWVLLHTPPTVSLAQLLAAAGVTSVPRIEDIVYAATQAAIWHFSDGFTLTEWKRQDARGAFTQAQYAVLQTIYSYLTGSANNGEQQPGPSLSITPDMLSGPVGTKLGPFTVSTTADKIALSVDGGKIVDEKGEPVASATDGTKFFVVRDTVGSVTVNASGVGTVPVGRLFVFQKDPTKAQRVIIAQPAKKPVAAKITANFTAATVSPSPSPTMSPTPSPTPPALPSTGASVVGKLGLAAILVAVGTSLTLVARRRRRTT